MVLGQLVKEDCSAPDNARVGTIVKITKYELGKDSNYFRLCGPVDEYPDQFSMIRPGHVVSVRWQNDHTRLTTHVFYDDIEESIVNINGSNTIVVVKD